MPILRKEKNKLLLIIGIVYYVSGLLLLAYVISIPILNSKKESDSPDVINGNVILASHSGTADISYFNNLDKLKISDEVLILYNGKTYQYKIVNIYDYKIRQKT